MCHRIVKQGSVLSSNICSASTAELCDENNDGYAVVGSTMINDTLYVDDTTDLNSDMNETEDSHNHVMNFSKAKRLGVNHEKSSTIIVNKKIHDSMPSLWIGNNRIKQVSVAKLLGDMINEKGNNKDLINDRVKKGKSAIINCLAFCSEVTMGTHYVEAAITLYHSVFEKTVLFNCQAWRKLLKDDLKKLETVQLKYLKRILRSPQSTTNCFVFLELGILPLMFVLHIRQLSFLHHILLLEDNDPVRLVYKEQLSLPYEKNWGNETKELLKMYHLENIDLTELSYETWKQKVKQQVSECAFQKLSEEAKGKTKTKHLTYTSFTPQPYIHHYHPKISSTLFKIRSRNIECKANRKSQSDNLLCRLCNSEEETQEHLVNCSEIKTESDSLISLKSIMEKDVDLNNADVSEICRRISSFHDKVSNEQSE